MLAKHHWGKFLWEYIHTICIIDYPNLNINLQITKNTIELLKIIAESIPCDSCKTSFKNSLVSLKFSNINLSESMCLFKWSINEHNRINVKNNISIFSYNDAIKKYTK